MGLFEDFGPEAGGSALPVVFVVDIADDEG